MISTWRVLKSITRTVRFGYRFKTAAGKCRGVARDQDGRGLLFLGDTRASLFFFCSSELESKLAEEKTHCKVT